MKTPPPWTVGQIGYGETNNTRKRSSSRFAKVSRKWPPRGRREASVSEIVANARAGEGETGARGSRSKPRPMPEKLALSGESPNTQLNTAPAQAKKKCAASLRHSWMFFHTNSRKFVFSTDWM